MSDDASSWEVLAGNVAPPAAAAAAAHDAAAAVDDVGLAGLGNALAMLQLHRNSSSCAGIRAEVLDRMITALFDPTEVLLRMSPLSMDTIELIVSMATPQEAREVEIRVIKDARGMLTLRTFQLFMQGFAFTHTLNTVSLVGYHVDDAFMGPLAAALAQRRSPLRRLHFGFVRVTLAGWRQLADVCARHAAPHTLEVYHCAQLCSESLLHLVKSARARFVLYQESVGDTGFDALGTGLTENPGLQELVLETNPMTRVVCAALGKVVAGHPSLRRLVLGGCTTPSASTSVGPLLRALAKGSHKLEELAVDTVVLSPGSMGAIAALMKPPRALRVLELAVAALQQLCVAELAEGLRSSTSLCVLNLAGCKTLDDAGVTQLSAALAANPMLPLAELDLSNCAVGNDGCRALANAIGKGALARLRTLRLRKTPFALAGVQAMSGALSGLPTLRVLDLSAKPSLGSRAIAEIAAAFADNASLETLSFGEGALDLEGAEALAGMLRRNSKLKSLCLCGGRELGGAVASRLAGPMVDGANTTLQVLGLGNYVSKTSYAPHLEQVGHCTVLTGYTPVKCCPTHGHVVPSL